MVPDSLQQEDIRGGVGVECGMEGVCLPFKAGASQMAMDRAGGAFLLSPSPPPVAWGCLAGMDSSARDPRASVPLG